MGPGRTSTVHGCLVRQEGCGWPETTTSDKKTTAHSNMVAEQVLTSSGSPAKTRYESQLPLSSWNEHLRTVSPDNDSYSSSYSEWNADKNWSSQEWKSDALMEVRMGRLVNEQPPGLFAQHTDTLIVENDKPNSNTVAESDMSFKSKSFLHRLNDRVRKMLDQSSKMQHKTATNIL